MASHDLLVIGAGPGGYIAAIRAAQLGLDAACVDEHAELGGTCLRVGCIPSKALLESSARYWNTLHHADEHGFHVKDVRLDLSTMQERKDEVVSSLTRGVASLFKKNGVTAIHGRARLLSTGEDGVRVAIEKPAKGKKKKGETEELVVKNVIVATGTTPSSLPNVELDGDRIGTSTEALAWAKVPKHLVVIGAGVIGLELGSVWARLGAKVTVLEYLDRILPGTDAEIARAAQKIFEQQGLELRLGSRVTGAELKGKTQVVVECEDQEPITAQKLLVAVGRRPVTSDIGLEDVGVELDDRGFIEADRDFRTAAAGVFAIGDVIGGPQLAHKAEEEGVACAELIAGRRPGALHYDHIPAVVYTEPEIASVGRTEEQLEDDDVPYRKGRFPFRANGRARALGEMDGFVKMLVHEETDRILGVHIVGPRAGDLIAEAVAAMQFGATAEDLFLTSHAHPTLAECLKEAALATADRTLNL